MADSNGNHKGNKGIFALPNEVSLAFVAQRSPARQRTHARTDDDHKILLNIFDISSTRELLPLTPTCRQFHSLILRLIHNRLQIAAGLSGHILFLECHHPSARLTAPPLYCTPLGTEGLDSLLSDIKDENQYLGQVKKFGSLFTRFLPESNEPEFKQKQRHPAGDVPGSRTYQDATIRPKKLDQDNIVRDTVNVDAHELFSQLTTVAYLGKRESTRGLLCSIQEVAEGTIRVWRDWLSRHCESRSFTDNSTVVIHHAAETSDQQKMRSDSVIETCDPTKDSQVLWVNTRGEDVGIKFKVKRQKQRATNLPLMYTSDIELDVSYVVEFEGMGSGFISIECVLTSADMS